MIRRTILATVTLLIGFSSLSFGQDFLDNSYYCGIYAIYGAASALGKDVEFQPLIAEEFVSSRKGSSIEDLGRAADLVGVKLREQHGLGVESLRACKDPMILHVASSGQLSGYNHWILFLGVEDGKAKLLDSRKGLRLTPLSKLSARWDGVALIVYVGSEPYVNYQMVEVNNGILTVLLCILAILFGVLFSKVFSNVARPVAVFSVAMVVCSLIPIVDPDCIVRTDSTNNYIFATQEKNYFRSLGFEELAERLDETPSPLLVDARGQYSFHQGAIQNAINAPVDTSEGSLELIMESFDRETPVIVYCQSSACAYDETMALRLTGLGFDNITLYENGYVEWAQRMK